MNPSIYDEAVGPDLIEPVQVRRTYRRRSKPEEMTTDEHGTARGYNMGCKCGPCKEAQRVKANANRSRRQSLRIRVPSGRTENSGRPIPHGSGGYTNYGCRCDICRAGRREAMRAYRSRKPAEMNPEQHGTVAGYGMGCKCDACRAAVAARARGRAAKAGGWKRASVRTPGSR